MRSRTRTPDRHSLEVDIKLDRIGSEAQSIFELDIEGLGVAGDGRFEAAAAHEALWSVWLLRLDFHSEGRPRQNLQPKRGDDHTEVARYGWHPHARVCAVALVVDAAAHLCRPADRDKEGIAALAHPGTRLIISLDDKVHLVMCGGLSGCVREDDAALGRAEYAFAGHITRWRQVGGNTNRRICLAHGLLQRGLHAQLIRGGDVGS